MKTSSPCPKCGSIAHLRKTTLRFTRGGFQIRIDGVSAYRCSACGHETLPGPIAIAVMDLFDQVYKATQALRKAGALPAPDIRLKFPTKRIAA